ncbi:hypothetical protein TWF481_003099 [Arthrobotrys musiformis]|uniref:Uncharacterized protein n=1 Tax=Arthrobotrys musiformis TaxID=47236 RepID=A0AAV9VP88_9PEZI
MDNIRNKTFAFFATLLVFLKYSLSLLSTPLSMTKTIRTLFKSTKPPSTFRHRYHPPPRKKPNRTDGIKPKAMDAPSIYDHPRYSYDRMNTKPRPPKTRITLSKYFFPWDGTLPQTCITPNPQYQRVKHWLHKSSRRPVIDNPFSQENEDKTEPPPPEYPYEYPPPFDTDAAKNLKRVLPSTSTFHNDIGTIVIPRHHDSADFLLIISQTENDAAPPKGPSAIVARFLVCCRTVRYHIPSLRAQSAYGSFVDGQRIPLPGGKDKVYPFFLFQLPQTCLTSLWIILTILHSRFPKAWERLDMPLSLLYNISKSIQVLEISDTQSVDLIKQKLLYTLTRHASQFTPPSNTPDISKWMTIAKTFSINTNFPSLYAHLIVSTCRFTPSSKTVDRYLPPTQTAGEGTTFKYGNWYPLSLLPTSLRTSLTTDRVRFLHGMIHPWSWFRSKYHFPTQPSGTFSSILSTNTTFDASALDLRDKITKYADDTLKYQTHIATITPGTAGELSARVISDITALKDDITTPFEEVESRDVSHNRTKVPASQYLTPQPPPPLHPPYQTPLEIDPISGLTPTIFLYQSGPNNSLIYWRNLPPVTNSIPKYTTILSLKISSLLLLSLLLQFYIELASLLQTHRFATFETRVTVWVLILVYHLSTTTAPTLERQQRINLQKELDEEELDETAHAYAWTDISTPGSHKPKAMGVRVGYGWKKFTPAEDYPENIYLAARKEAEVRRFKRERVERWKKEGRDRKGRLPGDEGFNAADVPVVDVADDDADAEWEGRVGDGYGMP